MYARFGKRALDLALAVPALVAFAPLMAGTAIAVRFRHGSPIIFAQERPGLGGKIFRMYKFRTMTDQRDETGQMLPDADRMTKLGRFLRASSLDELPELWNVILGDMSLVGPRPLLVEYLDYYTPEQARRHEVKPGITGWAQVKGRNSISWEEKFKLDVDYVDNVNLRKDLEICIRTVWSLCRREGVSAEGHATMPRFDEQRINAAGSVDFSDRKFGALE